MSKLFNDNVVPGLEMIKINRNDKDVKAIENLFRDLSNIVMENPNAFPDSESFFNFDATADIIKKIDEKIQHRFGLNTKHIADNDQFGVYAVIPNLPIGFNALNKMSDVIAKMLADMLGQYGINKYNTKPVEEIKSMRDDEESVMYHLYKSIKAIDKQMKVSGVKFDLKKAYISNLPKEHINFILVNYYNIFKILELTPEEVTGILLHEIGHAFTHLEYMYKSFRNVTLLADVMRDEVSKGKSVKETIKIIHKTATGKNDEDKDVITLVTEAYDYAVNPDRVLDDKNLHSSIDSEQLADQFSARFGYGEYLASSLLKFTEKGFKLYVNYLKEQTKEFLGIGIILAVYILILTMSASGLVLALAAIPVMGLVPIASFVIGSILYLFLSPIISLIGNLLKVVFTGTTEDEATYDETMRRIERILNEQVRQLRTGNLPPKDRKEVLKAFDSIRNVMSKVKPPRTPITKRIISAITINDDKEIISRQMIGEIIEDLQENRLHVGSARVDDLIDSMEERPAKNIFDEMFRKVNK